MRRRVALQVKKHALGIRVHRHVKVDNGQDKRVGGSIQCYGHFFSSASCSESEKRSCSSAWARGLVCGFKPVQRGASAAPDMDLCGRHLGDGMS